MALFPQYIIKSFALSSVLSLSSVSFAEAASSVVIGKAYDPEKGTLLYTETHEKVSDVTHTVEYKEPDGSVFAKKTIDSSLSAITPSFTQLNQRIGEKIAVQQQGDAMQVRYQENLTAKENVGSVNLSSGMVVDAGFDAFVKQYWTVLQSGKSMDIKYLVPSEQDYFNFRFKRTPCLENTQEGAVCFALSPISWVIKLAVDPIVVAYEPSQKALLRFTGRANIANAKGEYKKVDIYYQYSKEG